MLEKPFWKILEFWPLAEAYPRGDPMDPRIPPGASRAPSIWAPGDRWSEWLKKDVFPGMVMWPKTKAKKEGVSFRNMTVDIESACDHKQPCWPVGT